jgi:nitroreductase
MMMRPWTAIPPAPPPSDTNPDKDNAVDALEAIFARRSIGTLVEPAPSPEELDLLLAAASAAPDHGEARPWRFVVFTGEARADFGAVLEQAVRDDAAAAGAEPEQRLLDKAPTRFLRAPMIIVVLCRHQARRVLPAEQRDAVAAATQNLLVAATALGYGSMWRTGEAASSPTVKRALGLEEADSIIGFIYLGTVPDGNAKPPRRPDPAAFVEPAPTPHR